MGGVWERCWGRGERGGRGVGGEQDLANAGWRVLCLPSGMLLLGVRGRAGLPPWVEKPRSGGRKVPDSERSANLQPGWIWRRKGRG